MLEELQKELARPVEQCDDNDIYQSVFIGFIAHLAEEDVKELLQQPEVDEVEEVGAKQRKSASKRPGSALTAGQQQSLARPLSRNAWSRTLGVKGEKSTKQFAWFAPSAEKRWPSLSDQIGTEKTMPGRDTYIDSAGRVGKKADNRDKARYDRLQVERQRRAQAAADRRDGYRELPLVLSESAQNNLVALESRRLPPTEEELRERRARRQLLLDTRKMLAEASGRAASNVPMSEVEEYLAAREAAARHAAAAKFR